MNCSKLCFLCSESKSELINLSQYHGTCGKHNLDTFITCIHCGSIVPVIKILVPDKDLEIIDNKEQPIITIELKLDANERPEDSNESLRQKIIIQEPANKTEKIEFEDPIHFEIERPVDESSVYQEFKECEDKQDEKSGKCPFFHIIKAAPLLLVISAVYIKRKGILEWSKSLFSK